MVFTPKGGTSELIQQSPMAGCTDGWRYSDDRTRVDLCTNTCKRVQADADPQVDVLFGCTTQVGPIR